MTEDEAKTKACFQAATFGASQQLADGPGPNCIGSACMAWRWSGAVPQPQLGSTDFALGVLGNADQRAEVQAKARSKRPGFCGLAGAIS